LRSPTHTNKNAVIIGAGISGLTAAYLLTSRGYDVKVLEKSERSGGTIRTEYFDGYMIEHGPNSTLETTPLIDELLKMLGILNKKIPANESAKKRYILKNGKILPLPMSPPSFISSKLFSAKAKLRLFKEPFIKSKSNPSESIADFTRRRLGTEFLDYAINPFVAGVFAGDPENLNVKTAFPKLYELEQKYGSLIGGSLKSRKERKNRNEESKQSAKTISFSGGMQQLTDALFLKLKGRIEFDCAVSGILKNNGKYTVNYRKNSEDIALESDIVILSVPAYAAAPLISGLDTALSGELSKVYYPPVNIIYTGFRTKDIKFNLDGFGFLIPGKENRKILGSLWTSVIFPGRAPEGSYLLTNFTGGSRSPEMADLNDEENVRIVRDELDSIIGLNNSPVFSKIIRWEKAIPQYGKNYSAITDMIENFSAVNSGLYICSNFFKGISVCDCIKNAFETANKITE